MYTVLNSRGELYFIEKKVDGNYIPVGNVTFCRDDMPIVIAKPYRNQGIGRKVIRLLIERAKTLGYTEVRVKEIFEYNTASQRLFKSCGFKKLTDMGASYSLDL